MAQSIGYWYDKMSTEKSTMSNLSVYQPNIDSTQTLLDDLKSTSKVARWRLLFWCIACCAYAIDVMLSVFRIEISDLISKSKYGSLPWYPIMAKEFQYGDTLSFNGREYVYPVIDVTKQIIKRASALDATGQVTLKIAKVVSGVNTKLDASEEAAALIYFKRRKAPGIELVIINSDADEVKLYVTINYDPLLMNSSGELISDTSIKPAEDKANEYINTLNDDFEGYFELMSLIDKIQEGKDQGVISAYVTNAEGRKGTDPFVQFDERYLPYAGHVKVAVGFDLSTTFTYVPNV
jgi:hypothetical protein